MYPVIHEPYHHEMFVLVIHCDVTNHIHHLMQSAANMTKHAHTQDNFSLILWNKKTSCNCIVPCFKPVIQQDNLGLGNLACVSAKTILKTTDTNRLPVEQQGPRASQEQTQRKFYIKIAVL